MRVRDAARRKVPVLALALVALAAAGCDSLYTGTPPPPGVDQMGAKLVALHNSARGAAGVGPLTSSAANQTDAQATANRLMLSSGGGCKLVHTSANTMQAWYGAVWAENIACAPNSPQWVCADVAQFHDLFMGSPTHRADILNGGYGHVGVGVACGGTYTFVVVHFSP